MTHRHEMEYDGPEEDCSRCLKARLAEAERLNEELLKRNSVQMRRLMAHHKGNIGACFDCDPAGRDSGNDADSDVQAVRKESEATAAANLGGVVGTENDDARLFMRRRLSAANPGGVPTLEVVENPYRRRRRSAETHEGPDPYPPNPPPSEPPGYYREQAERRSKKAKRT